MLHRNQSPKRFMPKIYPVKQAEGFCGLRLKNVRSNQQGAVGIVRL